MLQIFTGNIQLGLFVFPANLLLLFMLFLLVWTEHRLGKKNNKRSRLTTPFQIKTAFIALIAAMLVLGLVPQHWVDEPIPGVDAFWYVLVYKLGLHSFATSWIFASVMVHFVLVLMAVVMQGLVRLSSKLRQSEHRLRTLLRESPFVLNHLGLCLALVAGYFGCSDEINGKMILDREKASDLAYIQTGGQHYLPFYMILVDFDLEYQEDGELLNYRAGLHFTDKKDAKLSSRELKVNRPIHYKGYNVYLHSYEVEKGEQSRYVVLLITRQPWKYLLYSGILLMILGALGLFVSYAAKLKRQKT